MALDRALARRGGTRWNTDETAGVPPSTAPNAGDFREKSEGGTPGTRGTPKTEKVRAEPPSPIEREAIANEGAIAFDGDMAATIAEARALAGITRRGKECLEDPNRCDCGGRCPWGFR